jgi:hypothetical protein
MRQNLKRYVAKIDIYVYAEDDKQAHEITESICTDLDSSGTEKNASILELGEQPFASLEYRKINLLKL